MNAWMWLMPLPFPLDQTALFAWTPTGALLAAVGIALAPDLDVEVSMCIWTSVHYSHAASEDTRERARGHGASEITSVLIGPWHFQETLWTLICPHEYVRINAE